MLECKGFEPKEKLTQIVGMNGELQSYLEVKYRIEWFNQYCAENDIKVSLMNQILNILNKLKCLLQLVKFIWMINWLQQVLVAKWLMVI